MSKRLKKNLGRVSLVTVLVVLGIVLVLILIYERVSIN